MTKAELEDLLDVVATRAKALVDAGVRTLSIDGVKLRLAAPEPVAPAVDPTAEQPAPSRIDPMNDPATYGLPAGSKLPGIAWANEMLQSQANRERELGMKPRKG